MPRKIEACVVLLVTSTISWARFAAHITPYTIRKMKQVLIETVLLEQQDELDVLRGRKLVHRSEEKLINFNSSLAQVVVGVRRSGKSTLCFNALESAKVKYAYVNFDDERFFNMKAEDLDNVLATLYRIYGRFDCLFMDEIQNVEAWPLFVNRLLRQGLHIVLTGSNAKLLSSELATHLTGRHHKIELYPFSFVDWCKIKDVNFTRMTTKNRGLLEKVYDEYMRKGGFPELLFKENTREYIDSLFNNIITQDIQKRFKVRNIDELKLMANHMLNEAPAFIVKEVLERTCGIKSDHTVVKFLSYLSQTYIISTVSKYSTRSRERVRNDKYYAIDVAFMDNRENALAKENLGWRLETIVYLELRRRYNGSGFDVYYYKDKTAEADFVVCDKSKAVAVYQVSYDISVKKTLKREIRGCIAAAKATRCNQIFLITEYEKKDLEVDSYSIAVRPAYEWLCSQ